MLQRFAPIVAADPPDGIVIDSTGADHLHGGEAATLATLVEKLTGIGLRSRAAIADTWGAAHALARFDARPGFVSEPGNAARDVAQLSIAALRLPSDMVRDLHVLGVSRHRWGLIDSWCKSLLTAASSERGATQHRRGHTWLA
jgi:protein ImuB